MLKSIMLAALILVMVLGGIHFHGSDLLHHNDCLACSLGHSLILETTLLLSLFTLLFVKKIFPQNAHFSQVKQFNQRLRAPPF